MRDFFIVLPAPADHMTLILRKEPIPMWGTRNEAMRVADSLARQTNSDFVVLGVVGRTGPEQPHDPSYQFTPNAKVRAPLEAVA